MMKTYYGDATREAIADALWYAMRDTAGSKSADLLWDALWDQTGDELWDAISRWWHGVAETRMACGMAAISDLAIQPSSLSFVVRTN